MIKVKRNASIDGCRKEILLALVTKIHPVFEAENVDTVVTSGTEVYKHSVTRSAHYRGDALDLRSKHLFPKRTKMKVYNSLKRRLGRDFVVILESVGKPWEHFHIHWSPIHHE